MSKNAPESGKSDQRVSPVARGGDEQRAVGERRPCVLGERGIGLGQHLPADGHVMRHAHAVERVSLCL
jgi:hypothetical protein